MPNWKTYESSVRLLSAIIAAHPDLKLNYDGKQINFLFSLLSAIYTTLAPSLLCIILLFAQILILSILRYS